MSKTLNYITIIAISAIIFFSISKLADAFFIRSIQPIKKINQVYVEHDTLNHVFTKNYKTIRKVHKDIPKYTFETNSMGLKNINGDNFAKKDSNLFRILVLGDSFVAGYKFDSTLSTLIQNTLNKIRYKNKQVEVINAGIGSYSTILHYFHYKYYLQQLNPDLIVLAIDVTDLRDDVFYNGFLLYDENNKEIGVLPSYGGTSKKLNITINEMLNRSNIFSKHWLIASISKNSEIFKHLFFAKRMNMYYRQFINTEYIDDYISIACGKHEKSSFAYELLFRYIIKLKNLIQNDNSKLILSIYPHYVLLENNYNTYFERIKNFSDSNNINVHSLLNDVLKKQNYSKLYLKDNMHFNYLGTNLWAQSLSNYLISLEQ